MPATDSEPSPRVADLPTWRERLDLLAGGEGVRVSQVVAAAVAVVAVAVGVVVFLRRPAPPPELTLPRADAAAPAPGSEAGSTASSVPEEVYAHAAGAVARPGVYRLAAGSRVTDLIDAAGGLTPDADANQLNLAARVADGERVYVPRAGETVPAAPSAGGNGPGGSADPGGIVNLNTAGLVELESLPGVGPATAEAIIDHRERHGPFRSIEDLLDVRGIGDAKLEQLRERVTV